MVFDNLLIEMCYFFVVEMVFCEIVFIFCCLVNKWFMSCDIYFVKVYSGCCMNSVDNVGYCYVLCCGWWYKCCYLFFSWFDYEYFFCFLIDLVSICCGLIGLFRCV